MDITQLILDDHHEQRVVSRTWSRSALPASRRCPTFGPVLRYSSKSMPRPRKRSSTRSW